MRGKVAFVAAASAAVESYDYFIFGTAAALVFGKQFYPSFSPVAGVLASFGTFAVGFLARPVGGVMAGHFGDRIGRKPVLVGALLLMGVSTTLIGLLPGYDTIGVAAPVLLVVLRLVQGVALSGQWGGAMLLATEFAPPGKRGLYGSLVQLGVPIGLILSNGTYLLAATVIAPEAFQAWGWRIPFLAGVVLIGLGVFTHRALDDTPEFRAVERKLAAEGDVARRSPVLTLLRHNSRTVLLAASTFVASNGTFYILITGVLDYTTRQLHMSGSSVLTVVLLSSALQLVLMPAFASLSDRVGRPKVVAVGAVGLALWAVPMFLLIDTASVSNLLIASIVAGTFLSLMYAPQAALFTELFGAEVRYSGASMGYQLAAVVGGGLAPFIMVLLLSWTGTSLSVAAYIIAMAVLALVSLRLLTRR